MGIILTVNMEMLLEPHQVENIDSIKLLNLLIEQIISLGAAAQNILLGIHEIGFAGVWRTGKMAFNPRITEKLGLKENFQIIGY